MCIFLLALLQFWSSIDLSHSIRSRSNFFFYPSTVGSLFPSFQSKRTTEKMSAKNGDKFEQQDVWGWGMPLWAALPRHQTLVYMICAFVHTTRKDVRSIYHFYVAYIRTCIYVYFVHLFFHSDLPSIYLIRSGDGRISSSILPRWDLFFHRCKERGQLKSWVQRTEIQSTSRKCGGWGMPLWAALPKHQRLVYIICICTYYA